MFTGWLVAVVTFPATSWIDKLDTRPAPSPLTPVSPGHDATPDRASWQAQRIGTAVRYHPLAFGLSSGVPVSVGGVRSMLTWLTVSFAVLPALSDAVTVRDRFVPSWSNVTAFGQLATNEVMSLHPNVATTGVS